MFGNVATLEGLHVTGKYRTQHDAHMLQAFSLGPPDECQVTWTQPASEREGENLERLERFYFKAKARIWP